MDAESGYQEYRPMVASRRGERIAWLSTSLVVSAWALFVVTEARVNLPLTIVAGLLGSVALGISLSNWMDRKTRIVLSQKGLHFQNGLRNVVITWREIRQVRVLPAIWGKKVQVFADNAYFGFNTQGEVKAYGKIVTQTGFAQGDQIVQQILERAHLNRVQTLDAGLGISGYAYTRE